MWFFQAVALDLDGTLAENDHLAETTITAIKASRDEHRIILVTGRTFSDLERVFPGLWGEFDAAVTENGAVLHTRSGVWPLADPVDPAVALMLTERGVDTRAGQVLVALAADDAGTAVDVITKLGLDCQVVRNRGAAMILPSGVTKATGLLAALDELGLSAHNTIAVGDAENDLALLQAAEVGAAVANAVPSLTAHADLRLRSRNGAGVTELLTGELLTGEQRLCPERHWLRIGAFDDGQPVLVPGSQGSILIAGDTGAGKSYLAGLLAERWIDAGYSVLITDPEGDHTGLAQRPGVHLVDAAAYLPSPTDLLAIARPGRASLVLDLSGLSETDKAQYLRRLPSAIAAERAGHGIPHWVITDEAQLFLGDESAPPAGPEVAEPGTCTITWRPELLPATFRDSVDLTLTIEGAPPAAANTTMAVKRVTVSVAGQPTRPFTVQGRVSPHVRHQHKYVTTVLPPDRRFYFRTSGGTSGEPVAAATVEEFSRHIRHCDPAVLGYHLSRGDFSRWITGSIADHHLGSDLAAIERDLDLRRAAELERARHRITRAIDNRYPGPSKPLPHVHVPRRHRPKYCGRMCDWRWPPASAGTRWRPPATSRSGRGGSRPGPAKLMSSRS